MSRPDPTRTLPRRGRPWGPWLAALAVLLFLLPGCAEKAYGPPEELMALGYVSDGMGGYAGDSSGAPAADMAELESVAVVAERSRMPAPKRGNAPAAPRTAAPPPPPPPPPPGEPARAEAPAPTPAAARMIHYSGWAQLRVIKVEDAIDQATALARAVGGEVEQVGSRSITLRVPVAAFQTTYDQLLMQLGDVLQKRVSAEDVTEAFTAVDLRLGTLRRTRDRLVALLAKAEDEAEKLALVQQIQRVSEEIDRTESMLRTLGRLASFSRITLELVPRAAQAWQGGEPDTYELAWIRALSPFRPDLLTEVGRRLDLPVPAGMVQLPPRKHFIAESADGARVWTGRLPNEPVGDGAWWAAAVVERLGREFASATTAQVGGFTVVTLVDRADRPYTWLIALRADGRHLDVVEAFFLSPDQAARYQEALLASLAALGGAA